MPPEENNQDSRTQLRVNLLSPLFVEMLDHLRLQWATHTVANNDPCVILNKEDLIKRFICEGLMRYGYDWTLVGIVQRYDWSATKFERAYNRKDRDECLTPFKSIEQ